MLENPAWIAANSITISQGLIWWRKLGKEKLGPTQARTLGVERTSVQRTNKQSLYISPKGFQKTCGKGSYGLLLR